MHEFLNIALKSSGIGPMKPLDDLTDYMPLIGMKEVQEFASHVQIVMRFNSSIWKLTVHYYEYPNNFLL